MAKKRIPIDKERFETLKNELVRVSNIDLSSDNAYSDLCDDIKKQSNTNFPLPKYEDGSIIRKSKFPPNPERSVQFSGKRTKRSVQKKGCTQHL